MQSNADEVQEPRLQTLDEIAEITTNLTEAGRSHSKGEVALADIKADAREDFKPRPITEAEHRAEVADEHGSPDALESSVVPHPPKFAPAEEVCAATVDLNQGHVLDDEGMLRTQAEIDRRVEEKEDPRKEDVVNKPSHYNYGEIECIDAIRAALGEDLFRGYCRGTAIKYTWRAGLKRNEKQDLAKAVWFSRMAAGDDPR